MPAVGSYSLFKLIDIQDRSGEEALNIYWYLAQVAPDTVSAFAVGNAWEALFDSYLPPVQPGGCSHITWEVDEVTSISNFHTASSGIPDGDLTTPFLPNMLCASIRLLRTTKETRSGYKRIVAGNEATLTNNKWDAVMFGLLGELATIMSLNLVADGEACFPVIIRNTAVPGSSVDPEDPTTWIYNRVSEAVASEYVTTQNSRKLGRGS